MQYGAESAHGTAVAATKILPMAVPPIQPDREAIYPREDVGKRTDAYRSYIAGRMVSDKLKWDSAYWQSQAMLFSCGIQGGITPVEQTAGENDYLWAYDPPMDDTDPAQDSITLERGDDVFMVESEYVMFKRIKISGEINQEGKDSTEKIEAEYFGRQNTIATFTAGLTLPTLNSINSKLTRFFIDTTWAGAGGTEKTLTLRSYDLEILTGLHPKLFGSGSETFDTHGPGALNFLASFVLEGNSNALAIYSAFLAQSLAVVQLNTVGPQIGAGDPFSRVINMAGTWEKPIPLSGASNGNNLFAAVLHGKLDVTSGKLLTIALTTNHNTI